MFRGRACLGVLILGLLSLAITSTPQRSNARDAANDGQAITGRVTDPAGRGLGGVFVSLMRESDEPGARRLRPVNVRLFSITNPQGEFRLEHLAPDNYCVVALPHNVPVDTQNRPNRSGYAITYYPNVIRADDAKSVLVTRSAGATATITLAPARLSVVSGSVTDSTGGPASAARLSIAHGDGLFGLDGMATSTRPDGTFTLAGLPPGIYFLHMREGAWPPPPNVIPKISVAAVTVSDRDVMDVRVQPLPMVHATGRVVIDPAVRSSLHTSAMRISAMPMDNQGNPGPQRPGTLRDDLTFEFRTWPGLGYVRVFPESEWIIANIRLNGLDVTRTGVDFRAGRDVTGLEIELRKAPPR
jgi:hypothetical protein